MHAAVLCHRLPQLQCTLIYRHMFKTVLQHICGQFTNRLTHTPVVPLPHPPCRRLPRLCVASAGAQVVAAAAAATAGPPAPHHHPTAGLTRSGAHPHLTTSHHAPSPSTTPPPSASTRAATWAAAAHTGPASPARAHMTPHPVVTPATTTA